MHSAAEVVLGEPNAMESPCVGVTCSFHGVDESLPAVGAGCDVAQFDDGDSHRVDAPRDATTGIERDAIRLRQPEGEPSAGLTA